MLKLWGQDKGAYVLAAVLLAAGCGTVPARGQSAAPPPAASGSSEPSGRSAASGSQAAAAIWLDTLQMTSASTGWALRWTQNPAVVDDGYLAPARTTDGARTWTSVTPPAARALLTTPDAQAVLQALDGQRAWLAVTAATTDSSSVHLTEVFATANEGRTWTESAPLKVPDYASFLSFADPEHGWLLIAYGGTMGQEPVRLYRTSDGGLRWSLAAQTPQTGTGSNGLPVTCDKAGLVFATASAGWLSGACFFLPDALLVSRDGGVIWTSQVLPVPARSASPTSVRYSVRSSSAGPGSWSSTAAPRHRTSWSARISGRPGGVSRCRRAPGRTRGSSSSARAAACWCLAVRRGPSGRCSTPLRMAAGPGRRCGRDAPSANLGSISSASRPVSPGFPAPTRQDHHRPPCTGPLTPAGPG